MRSLPDRSLTEDEYLQREERSPLRHEFAAGQVFAMTGASLRHNVIALNLAAALRAHLRASPCRVFMADVRVRVARANAHYYPDVVVSCGPELQHLDPGTRAVEDALLVVEVLSANTEATDRREKLLAYRMLPSLREYVLVSQDEARVEVHRRRGDMGWEAIEYAGLEELELPSVGLRMAMREVYDGVPIEALVREPGDPLNPPAPS
jgi:Uma2 family endonuclease